jgi:hypothetical protein
MAMRFHPHTTLVMQSGRLEAVEIFSRHAPSGSGSVRLDPIQAEHIHARLSQIDFAFRHDIQTGELVTSLSPCGAEALPVSRIEGDTVTMDGLVIKTAQARLFLSPDEVTTVKNELERIVIDYLHDSVWGGEDARRQ